MRIPKSRCLVTSDSEILVSGVWGVGYTWGSAPLKAPGFGLSQFVATLEPCSLTFGISWKGYADHLQEQQWAMDLWWALYCTAIFSLLWMSGVSRWTGGLQMQGFMVRKEQAGGVFGVPCHGAPA